MRLQEKKDKKLLTSSIPPEGGKKAAAVDFLRLTSALSIKITLGNHRGQETNQSGREAQESERVTISHIHILGIGLELACNGGSCECFFQPIVYSTNAKQFLFDTPLKVTF